MKGLQMKDSKFAFEYLVWDNPQSRPETKYHHFKLNTCLGNEYREHQLKEEWTGLPIKLSKEISHALALKISLPYMIKYVDCFRLVNCLNDEKPFEFTPQEKVWTDNS